MIKSEGGRRHPSEAIPTGLTSPQPRGRSRRMKEPAELGPGHLRLVRGQYFPPGCQRPNSPFSNRKKPGDPHSSRIPRVTLHTHTSTYTHKVQGHPPRTVPLYKVLGHPSPCNLSLSHCARKPPNVLSHIQ